MHVLLTALAQYEPLPIPDDVPYDLLPEPVSLTLSIVFGVACVLGRNRIADFCASVAGWGPTYRRFCVRFCTAGGALLVIAAVVEAVRSLL